MMRTLRFTVGVVAMVFAAQPTVAQEVTFAYKFQPGTSERYSVKLNQEITMGSMAIGNLADMEVTVKCVSETEGKYAMELAFDKADVSTTMMGNTSSNPLGEQLVGKKIAFVASANGDISDIKPIGVIDSWDVARQLVEPVLEGWYPHLPNKAVAVGGSWKQDGKKKTEATGTESTTNATFTFKAMKKEKGRDLAVVEQALNTTIGGRSETAMGVFDVAGGGKGKGEILFDPAKGRVARIKGQIDLSMDMTPAAGGDPMKTVVTNHFERNLLE